MNLRGFPAGIIPMWNFLNVRFLRAIKTRIRHTQPSMSGDALSGFLQPGDADVSAAVSTGDLASADRADVLAFLPGARSVIILGRAVPPGVFGRASREKTRTMVQIATEVDHVAHRIAQDLEARGFHAVPVPLLIPLQEKYGGVRGMVNLKHIAATGGLGTIGKSSLLISPRYGNRLVLSGVVTSMDMPRRALTRPPDPCGDCDRCIRSCPGGAIHPGGVDAFLCRNVRPYLPGPLIPIARWLLRRRRLQDTLAPLAPLAFRFSSMRCSRCVTACPHFSDDKSGPD